MAPLSLGKACVVSSGKLEEVRSTSFVRECLLRVVIGSEWEIRVWIAVALRLCAVGGIVCE